MLELEKVEFLQTKGDSIEKGKMEKNSDETNSDSKLSLSDFRNLIHLIIHCFLVFKFVSLF